MHSSPISIRPWDNCGNPGRGVTGVEGHSPFAALFSASPRDAAEAADLLSDEGKHMGSARHGHGGPGGGPFARGG